MLYEVITENPEGPGEHEIRQVFAPLHPLEINGVKAQRRPVRINLPQAMLLAGENLFHRLRHKENA